MALADKGTLEGIHGLLAACISNRLEEAAEEGTDNPLSSAEITAISRFLSDNDISAVLGLDDSNSLAATLQGLIDSAGETFEPGQQPKEYHG